MTAVVQTPDIIFVVYDSLSSIDDLYLQLNKAQSSSTPIVFCLHGELSRNLSHKLGIFE